MSKNIISKVVEIDNASKDQVIKALYSEAVWRDISPVKEIDAHFPSPNVLYSKIRDEIKVVKVPIEIEGELIFSDLGEEAGKGRLIEFNMRNNKDVDRFEGRIRIKSLSPTQTKIGVFIQELKLTSEFLNLLGGASELILRTKLTELLRNLERLCKNDKLKELII